MLFEAFGALDTAGILKRYSNNIICQAVCAVEM